MKPRVAAPLLLGATFVVGIVAGVFLAPLLHPPPGPLPPSLQALHLSPGQRARIEAIVQKHGPEIEATLGEVAPRLRALQEKIALEIEAELDQPQREAFRRDRAKHPGPPPR